MTYLLKPLQIGGMELKNRLIMPPMATVKATSDGKVGPRELSLSEIEGIVAAFKNAILPMAICSISFSLL